MRLAIGVIALVGLPWPATAQSLPPLPDSAAIRIWAPSVGLKMQEARFVAWRPSSLVAVHATSGDSLDVPFPAITRLDGVQGTNVPGGLIGGAGAGIAVGVLVRTAGDLTETRLMTTWSWVGAAAAGGVLGVLFPPKRWVRQSLAPELGFGPKSVRSLPPLADGATIRIWAPSAGLKSQRARFVAWRTSSLAAVHATRGDSLDLPFQSITRLDLLDGKDVVAGVRAGAVGGALIGTFVGWGEGGSRTSGCTEFLCELEVMESFAMGMLGGLVVGSLLGAAFPPERWLPQLLPPDQGFPQAGRNHRQPVSPVLSIVLVRIGGT